MKNRIKIIMAMLVIAVGIGACDKDDDPVPSPSYSGTSGMDGTYRVSYFELNGVQHTEVFDQYVFDFQTNNMVIVTGGGKKAVGTWANKENNKFSLDFGSSEPFTVLNNSSWDIGTYTPTLLELKGRTGTDGTAALTFKKM